MLRTPQTKKTLNAELPYMGGVVKRFSLDENIVLKLRGHEPRNISYLRRLVGLELPAFDQNTIYGS